MGMSAFESFFFNSNLRRKEKVSLVFGCGIDNRNIYFDNKEKSIAGLLRLGWGAHSLVSQLQFQTQGRFSYCFPPLMRYCERSANTFIRFGADREVKPWFRSTPLLPYINPNIPSAYNLKPIGLSVNGGKLGIPENIFARKSDGTGGCVIETGSSLTFLDRPASATLEEALARDSPCLNLYITEGKNSHDVHEDTMNLKRHIQ
ncbi:Aspartic proteinase nepenthesin [Quillaja saponaria]|uniref:Aspartic proteinase nepenthesin n=1 Tax=Quillaja saponaria TaxID=32244 RepID=A0AAD7LF49_QUISA|nr:Aspartic proteinase nepenthesin [Quillaja saponaria]